MESKDEARENWKEEVSPSEYYFELIQAVGSNGLYQWIIIIICFVASFQNGIISLSSSYYFAVAPYTSCPPPHSDPAKCNAYVCSLPYSQRKQFEQPQIAQLKTLGNQYGDYHCERSAQLEPAKGIYFLGSILGDALSGPIADNKGRRPFFILGGISMVVGHLVIQLASGLGMVSVGLFVVGIGAETFFNVSVMVLSEVLENEERQKFLSVFQAFYPISGLIVVAAFYYIQNWRPVFLYVCLVPTVLLLILIVVVVQQTPQFLIKNHQVEDIRRSLGFVAKLNDRTESLQDDHRLSEVHLTALKEEYYAEMNQEHKKTFTYLDLFVFPSTRCITIWASLLFLTCNFLYLAPTMLFDQFGFDFYLNGVILNASELVTYIFSYIYITGLPRRMTNLISMSIVLFSCLALFLLGDNSICTHDCFTPKVILALVALFLMRFFLSFFYQLLYIYIAELFPVQIVGSALGLTVVIGSSLNPFTPGFLDLLKRNNLPVMLFFCLFAVVGILGSYFLEQTNGRPPKDRVEEIHHHVDHQLIEPDDS